MISVRSILTQKGHTIHAIAPEATVLDALRVMARHNVGALLIRDGERALGMLSERDYARKVVLHGRLSRDTPVGDIMEPAVFVPPGASIDACMALMTDRRTRHLVVRDQERIVGLVSIGDLVKAIIDEQQTMIAHLEHYITAG